MRLENTFRAFLRGAAQRRDGVGVTARNLLRLPYHPSTERTFRASIAARYGESPDQRTAYTAMLEDMLALSRQSSGAVVTTPRQDWEPLGDTGAHRRLNHIALSQHAKGYAG